MYPAGDPFPQQNDYKTYWSVVADTAVSPLNARVQTSIRICSLFPITPLTLYTSHRNIEVLYKPKRQRYRDENGPILSSKNMF